MSRSSNKKKPMPRIERVQPAPLAKSDATGWASILQRFNPLGAAAECYTRTLAYRLESRRLDLEEQRIVAQADCVLKTIESSFQLRMEELQQRRLLIEEAFGIARETLQLRHTERMVILECVPVIKASVTDSTLDAEARSRAMEMLGEMTRQLAGLGDQDVEALRSLTNVIPAVDASFSVSGSVDGVLPGGN